MPRPTITRFSFIRPLFLPLMLGAVVSALSGDASAQSVCKADEIQITAGKNLYCMHASPQPLTAGAAESYCKARKQGMLSLFTLAPLWNSNKDATAKLSPLILNKKLVVLGIAGSKTLTERYKITTPVQGGLRNLPDEPYKAQVLNFVCSVDVPVPTPK